MLIRNFMKKTDFQNACREKTGFQIDSDLEQHLYVAIERTIESPDFLKRQKTMISPEEVKRADAFYFKKDADRYVSAHSLLRMMLGRFANMRPPDLEFESGPNGKPFLKNDRRLQFNLSHSGEMIAIAVTMDRRIGIDIEKQVPLKDLSLISENIMNEQELREFGACKRDQKIAYFYRCWVRKEAAVKAMGMGIPEDFRKIPVIGRELIFPAPGFCSSSEIDPIKWIIEDVKTDSDYACAVCFEDKTG